MGSIKRRVAVYLVKEIYIFWYQKIQYSLFNEKVIVEYRCISHEYYVNKGIWNDAIKILIKSIYVKNLKNVNAKRKELVKFQQMRPYQN